MSRLITPPLPCGSAASGRRTSGVDVAVAVGLAGIIAAAFWGAIHTPFLFDDYSIVGDNLFMRSLWPLGEAMSAPRQSTAAGRPLVAYSFALNYAVSGLNVWSYHVFNLGVHWLNALLVYGLVRALSRWPRPLGAGVAALWAVHPLNSEAVVYVAQRTELLMALFVLASMACLVRSERVASRPRRAAGWSLAALACGLLGVLCKETAAVLPVLLLLFDRTFLAGRFSVAWRRRWPLHAGGLIVLALAGLIATGGHRGGIGWGDPTLSIRYLLTQGGVILHYLRLVLVPHPLSVTYEWPLVGLTFSALFPAGVLVAGLGAAVWGLVRRPVAGFFAAAFFLLLAPTSSIIPILSEVAAERRMYLPLLCILLPVAAGLGLVERQGVVLRHVGAWAAVASIGGAVWLSAARTADYRDAETLWRQTLAAQPGSLYARSNLAAELVGQDRLEEAEDLLLEVKSAAPGFPGIESGLGLIAFRRDDFPSAVLHYFRATQSPFVKPRDFAYAGYAMTRMGRVDEGVDLLERAIALDARDPVALGFMAAFLSNAGRYDDAIPVYEKVLGFYPEKAQEWGNLGYCLAQVGRPDAARSAFHTAVARDPENPTLLRNAANFEGGQGRFADAISYADRWRALRPDAVSPRLTLGSLHAAAGRPDLGVDVLREVVNAHPRHLEALQRLAIYLLASGDVSGASRILEQALAVSPGHAGNRAIADAIAAERTEVGP